MRLSLSSLYLSLLGLALILTGTAQQCPTVLLSGKTRPNSKRGVLAGKGKATITVRLRTKDPVDDLAFKMDLPSGLSVLRTVARPASKRIASPEIVQNLDGSTAIFWLGMDFTKSKGGKRVFRAKVVVDECAPEMLVITGLAYLANATATFCETPLTSPEVLRVRYGKSKRSVTCAPTPAPTVNPTQPFVLFGEGQRFSQGGVLAPFSGRRLSMHPAPSKTHVADRQLQAIDTTEACYEYCSLNANVSSPFFFNWNRVTSECFCCLSTCTPFIFDPAYDVYEVIIPATPVPTAVPSAQPSSSPTATPTPQIGRAHV